MPDTIILGDKSNRAYQDFAGKRLHVGDFIAQAHARSSSVYMSLYRIKEIVDTDCPAFVTFKDDQRIETWDKAFKLKCVSYGRDYKGRPFPEKQWDAASLKYEEGTFEDAKVKTITAVDRVIRLDLDV